MSNQESRPAAASHLPGASQQQSKASPAASSSWARHARGTQVPLELPYMSHSINMQLDLADHEAEANGTPLLNLPKAPAFHLRLGRQAVQHVHQGLRLLPARVARAALRRLVLVPRSRPLLESLKQRLGSTQTRYCVTSRPPPSRPFAAMEFSRRQGRRPSPRNAWRATAARSHLRGV